MGSEQIMNIYTNIASSGTFGINTNIFEINIINLSFVIGALLYYGRFTLISIITIRKALVLNRLAKIESRERDQDIKLKEAEENYLSSLRIAEFILSAKERKCAVVRAEVFKDFQKEKSRRIRLRNLDLDAIYEYRYREVYNKLLDDTFEYTYATLRRYLKNPKYRERKFKKKELRLRKVKRR